VNARFGLQQAPEIQVNFADLIARRVAIGARRGHAVAARVGGVGRDNVTALFRGDYEERVRRGDPVVGKPCEELVERISYCCSCRT
jgi:hypothetical protein